MRPFVQTFVLASQSAKKYYVHNDIFRYQDDVLHANGPTTDANFTAQQNHVVGTFEEVANGTTAVVLALSLTSSPQAQHNLLSFARLCVGLCSITITIAINRSI